MARLLRDPQRYIHRQLLLGDGALTPIDGRLRWKKLGRRIGSSDSRYQRHMLADRKASYAVVGKCFVKGAPHTYGWNGWEVFLFSGGSYGPFKRRCKARRFAERAVICEHRELRAYELWVEDPDSAAIAFVLNNENRSLCRHGRNSCMLRCGVHRGLDGWTIFAGYERELWKAQLFARARERWPEDVSAFELRLALSAVAVTKGGR